MVILPYSVITSIIFGKFSQSQKYWRL